MGAITKVCVQNYRSVNNTGRVKLETDLTTLVGPNGAGKSNLLEAVSLLRNKEEISSKDLSKYSQYDSSSDLNNVPILQTTIEDLNAESYPHLQSPLSPEDINTLSEVQLSNGLELSKRLDKGSITVTRYASGQLRIDLPCRVNVDNYTPYKELEEESSFKMEKEDGTFAVYHSQRKGEVVNTPTQFKITEQYSIEEFIEKREKELLNLISDLLGEISEQGLGLSNKYQEVGTLAECEIALRKQAQILETHLQHNPADLSPEFEDQEITVLDMGRDVELLLNLVPDIRRVEKGRGAILPPVFDSRELELLEESIAVDEIGDSTGYKGFIGLDGLTPERVSTLDRDQLNGRLEKCERRLEKRLNGFWDMQGANIADKKRTFPQEPEGRFTVESEISDGQLSILIGEEKGPIVPLAERSSGVQWIIALLLSAFEEVGHDPRDAGLFILDDPGLHLHPEAQEFLLMTLRSIADPNQVLYSTHSPFLIFVRRVNTVRIVEHNLGEGTNIKDGPRKKKEEGEIDVWAPVRTSLGSKIANLPFGASETILVEGYTDINCLQQFNDFLRKQTDRFAMDWEIRFVDFEGSHAQILSNFLKGEGLEHVILLDSDDGGWNTRENIYQSDINMDRVVMLHNTLETEKDEVAIEDIFPRSLYCKGAAACQPESVTGEDLEIAIDERGDDDYIESIKGEIKRLRNTTDGTGYSTNKGDYLDKACKIVLNDPERDEHKFVIERFEDLFKTLDSTLAEFRTDE